MVFVVVVLVVALLASGVSLMPMRRNARRALAANDAEADRNERFYRAAVPIGLVLTLSIIIGIAIWGAAVHLNVGWVIVLEGAVSAPLVFAALLCIEQWQKRRNP